MLLLADNTAGDRVAAAKVAAERAAAERAIAAKAAADKATAERVAAEGAAAERIAALRRDAETHRSGAEQARIHAGREEANQLARDLFAAGQTKQAEADGLLGRQE